MSSSVVIPDTLNVEQVLNVAAPVTYAIRKGPTVLTRQMQNSASSDNSSISYSITSNSIDNIISPYLLLEVPITVTLSGTGFSNPIGDYVPNNFALREWPIASITNVCNLQLNNRAVSCNPNDFIHEYSNFGYGPDSTSAMRRQLYESVTPLAKDVTQTYGQSVGSLRNPLSTFLGGSDAYPPRGSFNDSWNVTTNSTGTYSFTTTLFEPVVHPLLDQNPGELSRPGFCYLTQVQVNLSFVSNLFRLFSLNASGFAGTITDASVNIGNTSYLHYWQITAPRELPLPNTQILGYSLPNVSKTSIANPVAPNQTVTVTSAQQTLNGIPEKIYVYVKRSTLSVPGVPASELTDTWFRISNITVDFNNVSGQLANYDERDIYNQLVAREGGLPTFIEWKYYQGSVICIDTARDLQLTSGQAPGLIGGSYNLQIQLTVTNIHPTDTITASIYVATNTPYVFSTTPSGDSTITQGVLDATQIANAFSLPLTSSSTSGGDLWGGSFLSTLKSIGSKASDFLKKTGLVSKGLALFPETAEFAPVASALGYGKLTKRQLQSQMQKAQQRMYMGYNPLLN